MRLLLSIVIGLMLFSLPVLAQEEQGFVYNPDGCDFQITFPSEPRLTRRCHEELTDKCTQMTTYTEVIALDATVNVYVNCRPSDEAFRKNFTPDLLRTALIARPGVGALETYEITFSETENALMGALLGAGPTPNGNDVMIYVAQLWVGNHSVFSLEGELIGQQAEQADQLFAEILRSLRHVDEPVDSPVDNPEGATPQAAPETEDEAGEGEPAPK